MRFPTLLLLLFLAMLAGGCAGLHPRADYRSFVVVKEHYRLIRNLVYTPVDWPEKLPGDLYQPRRVRGSSPAVLLIHGGGLSGGDGRWQMDSIAKRLAKRGYVVLNVTYRQTPAWTYPAPVDDMREALKWMRDHAQEHDIDPDRIATFGYSAGAYLAASVGYEKQNRIRAVVAGGMPGDLDLYPGGALIPRFLGGTKEQIPERFYEASPVNHITRHSPPTFVFHATGDSIVPPEQAWATIHALERHSVPHEVYWISGKGHIRGFLFPDDAVNQATSFLDSRMSGN